MTRPPNLRALLLAVACWVCGHGPLHQAYTTETSADFHAAMESILPDQIRDYVAELADDKFEGREAGTPGGLAAADYLVERLQGLGLEAGGEDGSFFQPFGSGYRNVLARLSRGDAEPACQTLILGAHYDHIGRGSPKASLGKTGEIHNGADDNASGVSAVLEIAEAFSKLPRSPKRDILFAFWDAEEKGLLGSKYWAANPTVPLDRVVAAVNLDMIGRLRDEQLILFGTRTAAGYRRLVAMSNRQPNLRIDFSRSLVGNGDHYPFVDRQIPVLFAHTGVHGQYHRETDDANLVETEGVSRIARLLFGVAFELAERSECPSFRSASRAESAASVAHSDHGVGAVPLRLGAAWDPRKTEGPGVAISSVTPGSAADKAGIRPGDRLIEVAGQTIRSGEDLSGAVISAANPVEVLVQPPESQTVRALVVELAGEPLRLGITWRTDEAEPQTVIINAVVAGSAAAKAGLRPGDRVYQVAGCDLIDDKQFSHAITTLPGPLELLIEREGRLLTVTVQFELGGDSEALPVVEDRSKIGA